MRIDKKIRALPWPAEFREESRKLFRITVNQPVVDGERMLMVTFMVNRAIKKYPWKHEDTRQDFRLICSKKENRAAILKKNGCSLLVWSLGKAVRELADGFICSCYPGISEQDEKILAKWLGKNDTRNHFLDHLDTWTAAAVEAELQEKRDARGEIRDEEVSLCPEELPEGLVDYIRREILPQDNVLIYKKGNVRGLCFLCGESVKAEKQRFKQDSIVDCPICGSRVSCYLEGSDRFKAKYVQNIATIQKGIDGKTVSTKKVFRSWV